MKLYADADTTMKKEAIDRATSDINPLYSTEYDIKWKDDEGGGKIGKLESVKNCIDGKNLAVDTVIIRGLEKWQTKRK